MSILEQNWTIVMFPKVQIDTAVSYFLLKNFGESKFPGIGQAGLEFWTELPDGKNTDDLEKEGFILIDLGGGRFDHHGLGEANKKYSSSHLIAKYLEVAGRKDLRRLLEFARRDDLEGKGTISHDPIDRAFGLSALLTNLNKTFSDDPKKVMNLVLPMIVGHYIEENRRYELLPAEYQKLHQDGKVKIFSAKHFGNDMKVIYFESDNNSLAGHLRSSMVGADLVIQRLETGHVNFVTKQSRQIRLHKLARLVKLLEAEKNNITLEVDLAELEKPGRTNGLDHWFYDARANTLQNGGISPQKIPPSLLSYEELEQIVKKGLDISSDKPINFGKSKFSRGRGVV